MKVNKGLISIVVFLVITISSATANSTLWVNNQDTSLMPVNIFEDEKIIITIEDNENAESLDYKITTTEGELIQISEKEYLFKLPLGDSLAIVDLYYATDHLYQLAIFSIVTENTITVFGINKAMLDAMYAEQAASEASLAATAATMEPETALAMEDSGSGGGMAMAMAGYDIAFSGVNKFSTPQTYSGQTILVLEDGYVEYEGGVTFENCTVDVNGYMNLNFDVNMVDSNVAVLGGLKVEPGTVIHETGASSIIADGDSLNSGRITLEGEYSNPIRVYSDYTGTDAEFIVIQSESCATSTLKWIDFFGGWTNIQIYDKRLDEGISNCRFFAPNYGVYQNGVDELTDIKFCLFYWNSISIYLGIDDCYNNEVEFLLDNVVIDNNFDASSYGIIMDGWLTAPDYSTLRIQNSIITNSYCGWYLDYGSGSFYPPVMSNLAYYSNNYDDNLTNSGFQKNPMYLASSPFVAQSDPNVWSYYTDKSSVVADVNLGYDMWQAEPEQLLTSIHDDLTPRGNKGIGFGMPLPVSYATKVGDLYCDLVSDGIVNFKEFSVIAGEWGNTGSTPADLDEDGTVEIDDLDILSNNWLETSYIDLDVNDSGDFLTLTCQFVNDVNVVDYAFFIDGEYVASRDPYDHTTLLIDKKKYSNGVHSIRAVVRGDEDQPFVSANTRVNFDTPLSDVKWFEFFDPCNYFVIEGDIAAGYSAGVSVKDLDGTIIWSDTLSNDFTSLVDPNNFSDDVQYNVEFTYQLDPPPGGAAPAGASDGSGSGPALALGGKPSYKTAALIICMIDHSWTQNGTTITDTGTSRWAYKMIDDQGILPILLRGYGEHNQVRYEMFDKVFRKYKRIRYKHVNAHGNYQADANGIFTGDVLRTVFLFNDGLWPAWNSRFWTDRGNPVPAGYEWMNSSLESHYNLRHFPYTTDQLVITVVEPCYSLRNIATIDASNVITYQEDAIEWEDDNNQNAHWQYPYSDLCFSWSILSNHQFVLGSAEECINGSIATPFKKFMNKFWESLSVDNDNVEDALNDAIFVASTDVMLAFRRRGAGASYLDQIKLETNPD